jgi:ribosomal-protein-alanine N-acetyltransferase
LHPPLRQISVRRLMKLRIAPAHPRDLPALLALEEAAFPGDRMSRRALAHNVQSPRVSFLVAYEGKNLVGHALIAFRRGSGVARLTSLAVAPGEAGRGLGRRLLQAAERRAKAQGADRLRLEVRADNAPAIGLYERAAFVRRGRTEDYYEDGTAALRYEKALR